MKRATEEDPGPLRMTAKRFSREVEDWAVKISELAIRGRRLDAFASDDRIHRVVNGLIALAQHASDASTAYLVGEAELREAYRAERTPSLFDGLDPQAPPVELPTATPEPLPAAAEPEPAAVPVLCPDCGGLADRPYAARKANSRKACHFGRDGKARSMSVPPEQVRERREHPPELVAIEPEAEVVEASREIFETHPSPANESGHEDVSDETGVWRRCLKCDGDFDRPAGPPFQTCHHLHRRPEHFEAKPKPSQFMVYHGPEAGPLERVCLILAADFDSALDRAKSRIGWQVYNFPEGLVLDGPDGVSKRIALGDSIGGGLWLEEPRPEPRTGQSVRGNAKDQVPDELPKGNPRYYDVFHNQGLGNRVHVTHVKATNKAMASELAARWFKAHRPNVPAFRIDVAPVDERKAKEQQGRKAKDRQAVRELYEKEDHKARFAVERGESSPEQGAFAP